jgi:hypothetical protein
MLAAAICAAACYSSNYRRETEASVSLIVEQSDKLADYCRAGFIVGNRPLSSEEMGEFYYALQKVRGFAQMTARRDAGRASRQQFAELVDAYDQFVRDADRYRLSSARPQSGLAALLKEHDAVRERARAVRAALARE